MRCGTRVIAVDQVYNVINDYGLGEVIDSFFENSTIKDIMKSYLTVAKSRCKKAMQDTTVLWAENAKAKALRYVEGFSIADFTEEVKLKCMLYIASSILDQVDSYASGEKLMDGVNAIKEALSQGYFLGVFYTFVGYAVHEFANEARIKYFDAVALSQCKHFFEQEKEPET